MRCAYAAPPEAHEIQAWLQHLGIGLPYRGEGLANITFKVLLRLLQQKDRKHLEP